MRRFQMMLDEELDTALEERARLERVSKAELLRRYARSALGRRLPPLEDDPLWAVVGAADDHVDDEFSGQVADHVDDVLYGRASPGSP